MKFPDLSATETPYVVIGTALADPGAIDFADFPGLLSVTVTNGTQVTVVSYWSSEEHFVRGRASFLKRSCVTEVLTEHHVQRHLVRGKRFNLWSWFLAGLGVLVTLEGLRVHHDWLFRKPSLLVESQRALPLNYHEGDEFSEVLRIENRTLVAHDNLAVEASLLTAITPNADQSTISAQDLPKIAASPSVAPILAAGDSMQIRLNGTAPTAGDYDLAISVSSHAGVFGGRRGQPNSFPLRVWSDTPEVKWFPPQFSKNAALFTGELRNGTPAAKGVRCQLTLLRHPEISEGNFSSPSVHTVPEDDWEITGSGTATSATLEFQSGPRPEFGRTRFSLALGPLRSHSNSQWADITKELHTDCSESTGGTP
jgi:hypothetical protein